MIKFITPQIVFLIFTTISLFLIYKKRALIKVKRLSGQLSWKIWILVIMSLSIHGLLVQSLYQLISFIIDNTVHFANLTNWFGGGNIWASWLLTLLASIFVLSIVIILCTKVIPKRQVLPFLMAGIIAGITSQYLWYHLIGPFMLPMP